MNRGRGAWVGAALLGGALALACADAPREPWPVLEPEVPSPLPPQEAAEAEEPEPADTAARETAAEATSRRLSQIRGIWFGPPCGRRNYERRVYFTVTGQVRVEERVNPCPPDAVCVWSGVEVVKGTFRHEGERVALALDPTARDLAVEPPESLAVVTDTDGDLVLADGEDCRYYRASDETLERFMVDEDSSEDEQDGASPDREAERPSRP